MGKLPKSGMWHRQIEDDGRMTIDKRLLELNNGQTDEKRERSLIHIGSFFEANCESNHVTIEIDF
jgi:hypothetical protein